MEDLIRRSDAIEAVKENTLWMSLSKESKGMGKVEWSDYIIKQVDALDAINGIPAVEPKTVLTEEVREAIMRLTMCARHECAICKYNSNDEDTCEQYATKNMNILADAFREPKRGEWTYHMDECGNVKTVSCAVCGGWVDITIPEQVAKFEYCPYCGARMFDKDTNVPIKEGADDEML